jgi:hypothetical protein
MSLSVQASDGKNEKLKNPDIVCSSKDLELSKSINNKTVGLYSNVFYNDATIPTSDSKPMKVEAITFHWMLSPSDAAIMESIIQNAKNLTELNTKLAESKFSNTHEYQEFNKLTKSN